MNLENLNDVLELFEQIGGIGRENCVFFAQTDSANISESGSLSKAVAEKVANELTFGISGLVGEYIDSKKKSANSPKDFCKELNLDILNNYRQFLINETEETIAIIPMLFKGTLHWETDGAQVFLEGGRVIPKSIIEKIEINKFSFLTPTIRGVNFKLIDGHSLEFMAITNVKTLPYHIGNFNKFSRKYGNK